MSKHTEPAFPTSDRGDGFSAPGLTKREYFAVTLLQGLLGVEDARGIAWNDLAVEAAFLADKLIEVLDQA